MFTTLRISFARKKTEQLWAQTSDFILFNSQISKLTELIYA